MKEQIAQLVNAIRTLVNDDMDTLLQHAENKEYIKGVIRDSALGEEFIKTQIGIIGKAIEGIEHEVTQGMSLSEYDERMLKLSKNILGELKIDHKMEERY